ncbi:phage holin, partial [Escherichia coli]|uniref:phage holin n=1 Tax=Escherichia coli TaxID=562 RepID=UPI001FCED032
SHPVYLFLREFSLQDFRGGSVTPSQWAAIGVLGSLVFGLLTYLTNLYFKIKEDKRKAARGE